jgi:D-3-phosphoglycerate dehydrogenase
MPRFKVLLTDYAWPDLAIEQAILSEAGIELVVAPRQDEETLVELARDVDAIMTNWAKTTERVIAAGIGLDNIAVDYCTSRGILVTNVPDYCIIEVAEHTLALLLSLARKVAFYHAQTKSGRYALQEGPVLRRLEGQTLGIVGLGNIGAKIAQKAAALGMQVVGYDLREPAAAEQVRRMNLGELLATSDYVTLHVPLTDKTRHMIGPKELAGMKATAYLINTARGGLVDHAALAEALAAGKLAGAALDVQEPEPPDLSQPPYNDPRVIVTPHAAFASQESLENLRSRTAKQIVACLTGGSPENVVNRSALG